MNATTARLIFVYNADSGLFNTMADIGHKIFSPETYSCDLCALTHGYFRERRDWRAFVESLPVPCEFLHRDEFRARYPEHAALDLPLVLRAEADGLRICLTREELATYRDQNALQQAIERCGVTGDLKRSG